MRSRPQVLPLPLAPGQVIAFEAHYQGQAYAREWLRYAGVDGEHHHRFELSLQLDLTVFGQAGPPVHQRARLVCDAELRPRRYESGTAASTVVLDLEDRVVLATLPNGRRIEVPCERPDGLLESNLTGLQALLLAAGAVAERAAGPRAFRVFSVNALRPLSYGVTPCESGAERPLRWMSSLGEELEIDSVGLLRAVDSATAGVTIRRVEPPPPPPDWGAGLPPSERRPATTLCALVLRAEPPAALLLDGAAGLALPAWEAPDHDSPYLVERIVDHLRSDFGFVPFVRGVVRAESHPLTLRLEAVTEVEVRAPRGWAPAPPARWVDRDALDRAKVASPRHRRLIARRLTAARDDAAVPHWTRLHWLEGVEEWVATRLADAGRRVIVPLRAILHRSRGFVARVGTDAGEVYFKAVPARFAHSVVLTEWLSRRYPGELPCLLALDPARGWTLAEDFGGRDLSAAPAVELHQRALGRFAAIQRDLACEAVQLVETLGCPESPLAELGERVRSLASAPAAAAGLAPSERRALVDALPHIDALVAELGSLSFPATLEHGDLGGHNVRSVAGGFVYHDLTDARLAHPLFSLASYLAHSAALGAPTDGVADAYLAEWSAGGHGLRALELARLLLPLHRAVWLHRTGLTLEDVVFVPVAVLAANVRSFLSGMTPK